jgi:hypothetical protein
LEHENYTAKGKSVNEGQLPVPERVTQNLKNLEMFPSPSVTFNSLHKARFAAIDRMSCGAQSTTFTPRQKAM